MIIFLQMGNEKRISLKRTVFSAHYILSHYVLRLYPNTHGGSHSGLQQGVNVKLGPSEKVR